MTIIHNKRKCSAKIDPAVCLFYLDTTPGVTALYMLQSSYSCSQSVYVCDTILFSTTMQSSSLLHVGHTVMQRRNVVFHRSKPETL